MNKAKAAVLVSINQPFEIREYELTTPPEHYARLKLIASGVCGTDLHIHSGRLGSTANQIIGHEFIGVVESVAPGDAEDYGINVGDTAMVYIACPCGECILCKNGDEANCVNMQVTNGGNSEEAPHFHGGFAEYSYAPVANLIKLPDDIDPVMASVFACPGPTSLHSFSIMRKSGFRPEDVSTAIVQGTGPVGCFAMLYLSSLGVKNIIAVSKNIPDRELIYALGASEIIDISEKTNEEIISHIKALTGALGADLVYEASGSPSAIPLGMELLRNRGVYLIPGQYSNNGGIEIQPQLVTFKALALLGSSQYDKKDISDYISFLQTNKHLHSFIRTLATCYNVESINHAFDDARARKNIKTVLVPRP